METEEELDDTWLREDRRLREAIDAIGTDVHVWLLVLEQGSARMHALGDGEELVVGRHFNADVHVVDAMASRKHARLTRKGARVEVEDLGSRNGTSINGRVMKLKTPVEAGDTISIGDVTIQISESRGPVAGLRGLEPHAKLRDAMEQELVRARTLGGDGALLMIRGTGSAATLIPELVPKLLGVLRPVDRVAFYGGSIVEVMLPGISVPMAAALAQRLVDQGTATGQELRIGGVSFPGGGRTTAVLLERARHSMARTSGETPVVWAPPESEQTRGDGIEKTFESKSPAMRLVGATIAKVAPTLAPILLSGETGAGKEVLARRIVNLSNRQGAKLISVNCGAIAEQLIMATLFGHERGAFTGANARRQGVFEAADGGTLFLDEVGELSAAAQAALLRALETGRITRVGSTSEVEVDVRIISATNRRLQGLVDEGLFRADLLYRLNTIVIRVPPVRERPEDTLPLAREFLAEARSVYGVKATGFTDEAARLLVDYSWPGNVRELRNVVERASLVAEGTEVSAMDLGATFADSVEITEVSPLSLAEPIEFKDRVTQYERHLMIQALNESGWHRSAAAKLLRMPERTFRHKFKAFGLQNLAPEKDES